MPDLPEEAVEAAAFAFFGGKRDVWEQNPGDLQRPFRLAARRALAVAYPLLRQQSETEVREQIAQEIEAKLPPGGDGDDADWGDFIAHACYSAAARLARGAAQER